MVEYRDMVYLCGVTADDKSAPAKRQTEQILAKIDKLLLQAGTDKTKLLTAVIYLADIRECEMVFESWKNWVDPQNPPARATVQATLATPDTRVEIMVTACKREG